MVKFEKNISVLVSSFIDVYMPLRDVKWSNEKCCKNGDEILL